MFRLYEQTAAKCSKYITTAYSTSFSMGIKTLDKKFHDPIYGIYAFVRYADEIVDTFHDFDKKELLERFKKDTYIAIDEKISLNPILYCFQKVVNEFNIPHELIEAFFKSMEMDLYKNAYGNESYDEYIYGSAEVVGLMCLKVFTEGNEEQYYALKKPAKALGAAFQKVNFLRDMKSDFDERGRVYFPGIDFNNFKEEAKKQIEMEIQADFTEAKKGIDLLPNGAKAGVELAYLYYLKLFKKIKNESAVTILQTRIRVPDYQKLSILFWSILQNQFRNKLLGAS